ncbi:unnamed protein product [Sphenostylis stenocarpa]|uniref:Uncharacterized protein n=1 Tax=Sphenostylis stenocarpa TaxID=92480 RepID=A0AA86SHN4_9FABA|nr:unnamed protein product [Sphenostylis stenocarpa]
MPREPKSMGVKILWIWTFGTAAITNAMRTRIRDMEALMNAEPQQQQQQHDAATTDSSLADTFILPSDSVISDDKD